MYAFFLSCPSATFAYQYGGFVPREWLPAKGLLGSTDLDSGRLQIRIKLSSYSIMASRLLGSDLVGGEMTVNQHIQFCTGQGNRSLRPVMSIAIFGTLAMQTVLNLSPNILIEHGV